MILRTIHVGVGGRGQGLLEVIGRDAKFKPVGLIDSNSTTAKVAQYKLMEAGHRSVPVFSGMAGALTQIEADAMVICTPPRSHGEHVRMALSANMHALVDPPLTIEFNDARQLVGEADSAWVKLCVANSWRYGAVHQTISYLLNRPDNPHFPGQVKMVDYVCHRHRLEQGAQDYPWAAVWETASQHLDALGSWLGPVKRVTARSYAAPWTHWVHEANVSAFIEYETGALCNYVMSNDATANFSRIILQGERGALVLADGERLTFHPKPSQHGEAGAAEEVELLDSPRAEQGMVDEFFRYVVEDVEPGISAKNMLGTMGACEIVIRSARTRKAVERGEVGGG